MRTLLTLVFSFVFITLSAQIEVNNGWRGRFGERVVGNGDVTIQERNVDGFTGVTTCCSMDVELSEGPFSVRVEAESNLQEFLVTEVKGGHLHVGWADNANLKSKKSVTVYVSLPKLDYLKATSSSTVVGKTPFRGDDLEVIVNSSSKATLEFTGQKVTADASSSADLYLTGSATSITAEASSSSRVDAGEMTAEDGRADVSSSADIILNLKRSLKADASSSGSVVYYGDPTDVNSNTSSSGSVKKRN